MREYELTVLIHPDLEIDLEKPLTKVRDIIKANGGEITKEENQGKKKLAYRIRGEDFAVYTYFELNLPGSSVQKVDSTLNITDESLRHLLVSRDLKRPVEGEGDEAEEGKETKDAKNDKE
ncbi:30S ribosomal protein S6 [Candidatus Saccharibacteria bacterium]|nr:30S ribosomal protein S6 [Candidatus Saccharibacteria bacterium]